MVAFVSCLVRKEFFCPDQVYCVTHPSIGQKCMNELLVSHPLPPCAVNLFRNQLSRTLCNSWHFLLVAFAGNAREHSLNGREFFRMEQWTQSVFLCILYHRLASPLKAKENEIDKSLKKKNFYWLWSWIRSIVIFQLCG